MSVSFGVMREVKKGSKSPEACCQLMLSCPCKGLPLQRELLKWANALGVQPLLDICLKAGHTLVDKQLSVLAIELLGSDL